MRMAMIRDKNMNIKSKQTVIAAARRAVFAGIILLVVWLILLLLKGRFPSARRDLNTNMVPVTSASLIIRQNLGATLGTIALIGLMSLVTAGILLFIGILIGRLTKSPGWLVKVRDVLRLVLISAGTSIMVFVMGAIFLFYFSRLQPQPSHPNIIFWSAVFCSMPLAWLLVQTGHGILTNQTENISGLKQVCDVVIRLFIRLLKLVGLIIIITFFEVHLTAQPGLGRELIDNLGQFNYSVVFGVTWVFVVITVVVKLIAELIEIAYRYFTQQTTLIEPVSEKPIVKYGIPQGWLIFSLVLCAFIIFLAVFGPLLAPNGNQISLLNILQSPSAKHLLGTDELGRDILGRLLAGIRTDLLIGLACAVVVSVIAGGWAMLAAYCRRMDSWLGDSLEDIVMLPRDVICACPWLILLLLLMLLLDDHSVIYVAFIVGLVMLPHAAGTMQEAYRSPPGGKTWLKNVLLSIPVIFAFTAAGVILYVSTITYLGFGISPGIAELGMLVNTGNAYAQQAPWLVLRPIIILSVILLIWVMTGEALLERLGFRSKAVWSKTME
jgi:ABC-type dipeptide/oligopeptide/nickel transport system permease subunit